MLGGRERLSAVVAYSTRSLRSVTGGGSLDYRASLSNLTVSCMHSTTPHDVPLRVHMPLTLPLPPLLWWGGFLKRTVHGPEPKTADQENHTPFKDKTSARFGGTCCVLILPKNTSNAPLASIIKKIRLLELLMETLGNLKQASLAR